MVNFWAIYKSLLIGIFGAGVITSTTSVGVIHQDNSNQIDSFSKVAVSSNQQIELNIKNIAQYIKFSDEQEVLNHIKLKIGDRLYTPIISATQKAREHGLSNRESLQDSQAMLFVFDTPGVYGFWMKDMRFAIDICWLDSTGKVITIARRVPANSYPKSFYPKKPAQMVIETGSGALDNIKEGDQVYISL